MSRQRADRRRAPSIALATALCLLVAQSQPAFAYLKLGVTIDGQPKTLKWTQMPVQYFVSDTGVPGVSSSDFEAAVGRAFDTWQAVPTASIAYQFAGITTARPLDDDGRSTLGFLSRPDLDRVLASTDFLVDQTSGALLEADIFFNSSFQWSVAAAGEPGKYDLQTIALHEIGHLSGLGHSAIGETELLPDGGRRVTAAEAVMFPIAFPPGTITGRDLKADDIAGISDLYPDGDFSSTTGSISGRVTMDGQGVFGAHVVAFDPANGRLVANFSLNEQGQFSMAGLSPGPHIIRVEPLDDADLDSFFDTSLDTVDLDFRVSFLNRLVVVPRGGDSGAIEIKVVPK
ncbi:MAG TPA: matrixin family metalloprotease [Vicinamibacterales bacterium]|nr:matrixin family metalloprotease [Vicinamibacterales bacterium]